jgi:hypothetical protein
MKKRTILIAAIGILVGTLLSFLLFPSSSGTIGGPETPVRSYTRYTFFGREFELPFRLPNVLFDYSYLCLICIWVIVTAAIMISATGKSKKSVKAKGSV